MLPLSDCGQVPCHLISMSLSGGRHVILNSCAQPFKEARENKRHAKRNRDEDGKRQRDFLYGEPGRMARLKAPNDEQYAQAMDELEKAG